MTDYGEDVLKIDALFARSPQNSRECSLKRSEQNINELTSDEVRILLQYTTSKSIDDNEAISQTLKKQMILEKRNMFDPGRYFGSPQVQSLDDAFDRRIEQMFSRPSGYRSEINLHGILKHKAPVTGVADALKKSLNTTQHVSTSQNKLEKTKSTSNLHSTAKARLQLSQKPPHETVIRGSREHNKENNHSKVNKAASTRPSPRKVEQPTPLQKLRLKLKISRHH